MCDNDVPLGELELVLNGTTSAQLAMAVSRRSVVKIRKSDFVVGSRSCPDAATCMATFHELRTPRGGLSGSVGSLRSPIESDTSKRMSDFGAGWRISVQP